MGNARGVTRDFQALQKRRMAAYRLFQRDLNNSEIARRLKVCNQTVSRWRAQSAQGGAETLKAAGRAGRRALLDEKQLRTLVQRLLAGPERLGYATPLWTCERAAHLIASEFGVRYHAGHVWKVLRQLQWSPQRPVGRALERNEAAIGEWKKKTWPGIKKKLASKGAAQGWKTKATYPVDKTARVLRQWASSSSTKAG